MSEPILSKDISVVVQGPSNGVETERCLNSIRKHLPEAEIILSTWEKSNTTGFDYDEILLNKDPGYFYYSNKPNEKKNNVNRQIISTVNGIKKARQKYIFKIRTDFMITGMGFVNFFDQFNKSEERYRIFSQKLLACTYFTRNPRYPDSALAYPYHPSDVAFFGLKEDLLNLFDIPLMQQEDEFYWEFDGFLCNKFVPEQYIFLNCLTKNRRDFQMAFQHDVTAYNIEETERYLASNFVILNWPQFNLVPLRQFETGIDYQFSTRRINSCITHNEWMKLYKKYIDSSITIPTRDPERKRIIRTVRLLQIKKFIARLVVLPFIGKCNKKLRHQMRQKVVNFLQ